MAPSWLKYVNALAALLVTLSGTSMAFFGLIFRDTGQVVLGAIFFLVSLFLWFDVFSARTRARKRPALGGSRDIAKPASGRPPGKRTLVIHHSSRKSLFSCRHRGKLSALVPHPEAGECIIGPDTLNAVEPYASRFKYL